MKSLLPLLAACLAATPLGAQAAPPESPARVAAQPGLFDPQNLTAWCVVPFDAKKRGPVERAEMLQRLGFKNFAYDWRSKDVPSFDAEVEALHQHGINLVGLVVSDRRRGSERASHFGCHQAPRHSSTIVGHGIRRSDEDGSRTSMQRTEQEAERIRKIVALAAPCACKVELYNHNGWFGQPELVQAFRTWPSRVGMPAMALRVSTMQSAHWASAG
jgi:hypothetical protein